MGEVPRCLFSQTQHQVSLWTLNGVSLSFSLGLRSWCVSFFIRLGWFPGHEATDREGKKKDSSSLQLRLLHLWASFNENLDIFYFSHVMAETTDTQAEPTQGPPNPYAIITYDRLGRFQFSASLDYLHILNALHQPTKPKHLKKKVKTKGSILSYTGDSQDQVEILNVLLGVMHSWGYKLISTHGDGDITCIFLPSQ